MVPVPDKFETLRSVYGKAGGTHVNVIGLVKEFKPPWKTRGSDYGCILDLIDLTFGHADDPDHQSLPARCFHLSESRLPQVWAPGDIVILKAVRTSKWNETKILLTTKDTFWAIIPPSAIPAPPSSNLSPSQMASIRKSSPTFPIAPQVLAYAVSLASLHSQFAGMRSGEITSIPSVSAVAPAAAPAYGKKFALVKDVREQTFYDLVGQVCRMYSRDSSDCLELYFTDYTENRLLWNYHDESQVLGDADGNGNTLHRWPGPYGQLAITISLFPPHRYFALENIHEGDYVFLRNVHVKISRDCKLEGVLHTDHRYLEKVDISKLSHDDGDERVKDVMRRKLHYQKEYERKNPGSKKHIRQVPTPPSESFTETLKSGAKRKADEENSKPLTKKQRKQQRKQQKEAERAADAVDLAENGYNNSSSHTQSTSTPQPSLKSSDPQVSGNIRCAHHTKPIRLISDIKSLDYHINTPPKGEPYKLPFLNINSRAKVRVIDFFPSKIEDFCIRQPKKSIERAALEDELSSSSDEPDGGGASESEGDGTDCDWVWGFQLLLEDASPSSKPNRAPATDEQIEGNRVWVTVADKDAEYLLKLDATDLRRNEKTCAALKERLFFLWGGLLERMEKSKGQTGDDEDLFAMEPGSQGAGSQVFECCVKEYGVKVRLEGKRHGVDESQGASWSESEDDADVPRNLRGYGREWTFDRRWRMWGVTII